MMSLNRKNKPKRYNKVDHEIIIKKQHRLVFQSKKNAIIFNKNNGILLFSPPLKMIES